MARNKIGAFTMQGFREIFDFGRVRRKILQLQVARSIRGDGPPQRRTNRIEN